MYFLICLLPDPDFDWHIVFLRMDENHSLNSAMLCSALNARTTPQSIVQPMPNRSMYIVNVGYNEKSREKTLRSLVHDKKGVDIMRRCAPMVQKYMEATIEMLDLQRCANDAEYLASIEDAWNNLLADFMHLYNPASDASKCSGKCLKQKTVICLNRSRNVYGCWLHGYLHICQRGPRCYVVHTNHDLSRTCVLSGRSLGFMQGGDASYRQAGGGSKQQLFDYYRSLRDIQLSRDTTANEATSDAARIARETGRDHHTKVPDIVAHLEEIQVDMAKEEKRSEDVYENLATSVDRLHAARDDITPPPSDMPPRPMPYDAKKPAELKFGTAEKMHVNEAKQRSEELFKAAARFSLISISSEAKNLAEQSIRVGNRLVRTVITEVYEDFQRAENRVMYNTYRKCCAAHAARENVRQMFFRARRDGVFVCMPDIWNELDSYNKDIVELVPILERNPAFIEQIVDNIHWLWDVCNRSPHAMKHLVKNEKTGVSTMQLGGSEGACSLRQFALACMYYMRTGLVLDVPYSYTGEKKMILAPHPALLVDLPTDETHVRYFGSEAMTELQRCINGGFFSDTSADYNLNRFEETISTARGGGRKRKKENHTNDDGFSVQIEVSKRRRSKSKKEFESVIAMERSDGCAAGRVRITTGDEGFTTTLTEQQCTPFYMREPLLTSGTLQNTRRNVYSVDDIISARRYIMLTLNSYEHRIADLR